MFNIAGIVLASSLVVGNIQEENIPQEAKESMGYYVGTWRGELTQGDNKGSIQLSAKWVTGKHCILMTTAPCSIRWRRRVTRRQGPG